MSLERTDKSAKIKGLIYGLLFVFFNIFGGSILTKFKIPIITNNITFVVYFVLCVVALSFFHKELILFVKSFSKSYFETTFIVGFVTFCGIIATGIFIDVIGINNANEIEINEALNSNFILTAIAAIIFAPIVEELLFRYVIYNGLKKFNHILVHIIVGLLFGFFHVWGYVIIEREYIQLVNMLPYVVMSLGFSVAYSKTNNLLCSIIIHTTINLVAVLS